MKNSIFTSSIFSIFLITLILPTTLSQQPYIRQPTTQCDNTNNSTSTLGYTCNGVNRTCQSYLTFYATPPYTSVSTISTLFSVDPSSLSQLNSVPQTSTFATNRIVLIPVTCSCTGQYYQANTSYVIRTNDTELQISSTTFEGLSTCPAMRAQNRVLGGNLFPGTRITVPLRCACPTRNQSDEGTNYLLSYVVGSGDAVSIISERFGVGSERTLAANGLSVQDSVIFPFTTLLVPLEDPPSSSQVASTQSPPPSSPSTPPVNTPPPRGGSNRTWIYVVVGVVGGLVLASVIGVVIFCLFCGKKKRQNTKSKSEQAVSSQSFDSIEKPLRKEEDLDSQEFLESLSSIAQSLKVYTFKDLKIATEDFSESSRIKDSVYRGVINGDVAAIKKMNGDVSKEINILNKINHFNLIRLSGVGFNEGNWYLVYEYASNGTVSDWIFQKDDGQKVLNWTQRLQIALDIATGLNYLHRYTSPPHVHKDLNGSNVLLDKDFRAKIANFGLARSAEGQEGHFALTRHIVGTKGYMAPEYLENGFVSPKLDVYAFGVLMLEILTGKEVSLLHEQGNMQLSEVLTPVFDEENGQENVRNLMDPMLQGKYPEEIAVFLFKLIGNCVKKDPSNRPNMDDIFQSLSRISASSLSGEWAISISEHQTGPR